MPSLLPPNLMKMAKFLWITLPAVLFLAGCSSSFESVQRGFGSSFNAYDCSYDEIWHTAVGVVGERFSVVDSNKTAGIINAEYRPSILGWISNPRPGELVSVSISPGDDRRGIHTIEVAGREVAGAWPFGRDWQPTIVAEIKTHLPGKVSVRTQKNRWSAITTRGDTLIGIFLERLVSDTMQFTRLGQRFNILVSEVLQLRESRERRFWDWVGSGAILGGVAGSFLSPSLSEVQFRGSYGSFYGAFHGLAYGAIIGGAMEEVAVSDQIYRLQEMNLRDRCRAINAILSDTK